MEAKRKDKPETGNEISSLGQRITQFRDRRGISQYRLAVDAGLPQSTLSRLERGLLKGLNSSTLKRVADALNVSTDILTGDDLITSRDTYKRSVNDHVLNAVVKNSKSRMLFVDNNDIICFSNIDESSIGQPVSSQLNLSEWDSIRDYVVDQVEVQDELAPFRTNLTMDGESRKASVLAIADVGRNGIRTVPMMMVRFADRVGSGQGEGKDVISHLNGIIGSIRRLSKHAKGSSLNKTELTLLAVHELSQMVGCEEMAILRNTKTKTVVDSMWSCSTAGEVPASTFAGYSKQEIPGRLDRLIGFVGESGAYAIDESIAVFPVDADSPFLFAFQFD